MTHWILAVALLPVIVLSYYIYQKDKMSPEPLGQLMKAFALGLMSVPLSLLLSVPFGGLGFYPPEIATVLDAVKSAFFGAAIPEELAKLFVLWLLLRKNRHFDEHVDGIVYAVFVSLGFAALENIFYLYSNYEEYLSVGISRALFAVPGHFCFGVLMGYYYSLVKFYPKVSQKNRLLVILAPVIAHGVYDSILFVTSVTPAISGILVIAFLLFCHKMWKYGSRRIAEHLERDADILR
ncbi:MAG: PrsW family glutamic-type intramembrane protease [Bacteroidales bacterium]|nr:PrsW family glutamic-type intramembrane protease [Bacteroidales bacterium]